jgi:predicted GNAT family N-acyltransferase
VLTDRTYIALVLDVIVTDDRRGQGVGALLMDTLLCQPALQTVRSIELVCQPEVTKFYERWGFTSDVGRSALMRLTVSPPS